MRLVAAVTLAAAALLAAACGGQSAEQHAKERFGAYVQAEQARGRAEDDLRRVFGELARSAGKRDQAGVRAAVGRGKHALSEIDASLEIEIGSAEALAAYEPTRDDGRKLADALRRTRAGTKLVDRQLSIASRDPFLDTTANEREVGRLSSQITTTSVAAAFARRRAQRAIALALGVEPPLDVMYDVPQQSPSP